MVTAYVAGRERQRVSAEKTGSLPPIEEELLQRRREKEQNFPLFPPPPASPEPLPN